jgi:glycosyltransferase involved in cell wall biosynthesis
MNRISVIMIVKNEEENIKECIESILWVDEIIIIDDESSDNTLEIASQYPKVKIFKKKMDKGYGEQRNYALSKASGEWILSIDADERVTEDLKREIIERINKENYDGYVLRLKNMVFGRWWLDSSPSALRVFKRNKGRFSNTFVHEKVILDGSIGVLKNPLLHSSKAFMNIKNYIDEYLNDYTTKTAIDLENKGIRLNNFNVVYYFLVKPILVFFHRYIFRWYFLHGVRGLFLAQFIAMAYLIGYIKLWERQNKKENED